jgi:hypothetical protein
MSQEKFQNEYISARENSDLILKFKERNRKNVNFASEKNLSLTNFSTFHKKISSFSENNLSKGNFNITLKKFNPGLAKIKTLNNSLDQNKDLNYDSKSNLISSLSQFKNFSKIIKSKTIKKQELNEKTITNTEKNQNVFTFEKLSSKIKISDFLYKKDNHIFFTKTLRNNKSLSQNLSKFSEILKREISSPKRVNQNEKSNFSFGKSEGIVSQVNSLLHEKNFKKTFYETSRDTSEKNFFSQKESNSSFTKIVPKFINQIAINDYLIRNFNVGSQRVKQTNSK